MLLAETDPSPVSPFRGEPPSPTRGAGKKIRHRRRPSTAVDDDGLSGQPVTTATLPVRSNGVFFIGVAPLMPRTPSLRGAKRRSNPEMSPRRQSGLLRFARNDGGSTQTNPPESATRRWW